MTHHKQQYKPGDTVLVEGVVTDFNAGQPYGAVKVFFPAATDESFLLDGVTVVTPVDGVTAWHPQALVFDLGHYTAQEGAYEDEEAA